MEFLPRINYPDDFVARNVAKLSAVRAVSERSYSMTAEEIFYTNFLETYDWEKRPSIPQYHPSSEETQRMGPTLE